MGFGWGRHLNKQRVPAAGAVKHHAFIPACAASKTFRIWHTAAGLRIGYMLSNYQKIIDTEGKRKFYDFEDINALRYGLSARLGVGKVQLTGFYSLVPLIDPNRGSDVIPISLGLAFTFIK